MVHDRVKFWFDNLKAAAIIILGFGSAITYGQLPSTLDSSQGLQNAPAPSDETQESAPSVHDAVEVDTDEPSEEAPVAPVIQKKVGRVTREKGVQGTKAHERFEPETVNKSKYKMNGLPLDVDPD